jgi:hypothetical protein
VRKRWEELFVEPDYNPLDDNYDEPRIYYLQGIAAAYNISTAAKDEEELLAHIGVRIILQDCYNVILQ